MSSSPTTQIQFIRFALTLAVLGLWTVIPLDEGKRHAFVETLPPMPSGTHMLRAARGRHAALVSGSLRSMRRVKEVMGLLTASDGGGVDVYAALSVSPESYNLIAEFDTLAASTPGLVAYSVVEQQTREELPDLVALTPSAPYVTQPLPDGHAHAHSMLHYYNMARARAMLDAAAAAAGIVYEYVGHSRPDLSLFIPQHIDLDLFERFINSRPRAIDSACLERDEPSDGRGKDACELRIGCNETLRPGPLFRDLVPALGINMNFPTYAWAYNRQRSPAPFAPAGTSIAARALFQPQQATFSGINDQVLWGDLATMHAVMGVLYQLEGLWLDGITFSNFNPEPLLLMGTMRAVAGFPEFKPNSTAEVALSTPVVAYLQVVSVDLSYCLYPWDNPWLRPDACKIDYWEDPFYYPRKPIRR